MKRPNNFEKLPAILTTADLVLVLGVFQQTAVCYCRDGKIPAVLIGGKYYVSKEQFKNMFNGKEEI